MAKISPSAISTYKQCPLKFRLMYIDLIPVKAPSIEAEKGIVVHYILEKMFKLSPEKRVILHYKPTVVNAINELKSSKDFTGKPKLSYQFNNNSEKEKFTNSIIENLKIYFKNENPSKIQVKATEKFLQLKLKNNLKLNGFADRIDIDENNNEVIIDYKTGKKPNGKFQHSVIFQMTSYALILYGMTGKLPKAIKAIFLSTEANGIIEQVPTIKNILSTEKEYLNCWDDINKKINSSKWDANKGPLCDWCEFQELCPKFGGQTPELSNEKIQKYIQ